MKHNIGFFYAIAAYTLWGIVPIFWKQLDHIDSAEIVMHRMLWSFVLVAIFIIAMKQWSEFRQLFSEPKTLFRLFVASCLITANWGVFIWAVNSGHMVETSMGYFISPLINVSFGVLLFSETLRRGQIFALLVAALGVLYLIVAHGELPWISFALAISFTLYSVVKKTIRVPATHGLAIETMFFVLPALAYIVFIEMRGSGQSFANQTNAAMLILGGLFTLVPLLLFAAAAKRVSMTVLGMSQYIGPTLQLLTGVLIYNEEFGSVRMVAFSLIWLALAIYTTDQLRHQRKVRRDAYRPV